MGRSALRFILDLRLLGGSSPQLPSASAIEAPHIEGARELSRGKSGRRQLLISRFVDASPSKFLVTPPNTHSRKRLCPYPPEIVRSAPISTLACNSASVASAC